jgi:very-short-patch-repair endonuclease
MATRVTKLTAADVPARFLPPDLPKAPRRRRKKGDPPAAPSALEQALAAQIRLTGLPTPVTEHRFHASRAWRFDFAWPDRHLALEVEGGVWLGGRHQRGQGYTDDCAKYSEAAIAGWRLLRVTGEHVKNGQALVWLEQALGAKDGAR